MEAIVIDNFETESCLNLKNLINWQTQSMSPVWCNFNDDTSQSVLKEWTKNFWIKFMKDVSNFEGFEYWLHDYNDYNLLEAHRDRDEAHFKNTGEEKYPVVGLVYYLHNEAPNGGELLIKYDDGNVDTVDALPNRVVVFNSSNLHSVNPVVSGVRKCLVSNVWQQKPDERNFV